MLDFWREILGVDTIPIPTLLVLHCELPVNPPLQFPEIVALAIVPCVQVCAVREALAFHLLLGTFTANPSMSPQCIKDAILYLLRSWNSTPKNPLCCRIIILLA